jgi:dsDNA-specific endonuclease/ATPase MutS2
MNFDQLWIGDPVFVVSKNSNGAWEGYTGESQAKVRVGHTTFVVDLTDLEPARFGKPKPAKKADAPLAKKPKQERPDFSSAALDLHMDVLAPDRVNDPPQMILTHQLKACQAFIEQSIAAMRPSIVIIHGKGEGVLKAEVEHLIAEYPQIKFTFPKHDGGAIEALLQY